MSIDTILNTAALDVIAHLGETFKVNGIEYTGVFTDSEYVDETGSKKVVVLSVTADVAKQFRRGDVVFGREASFKISKIPPLHGPMIELELKYA